MQFSSSATTTASRRMSTLRKMIDAASAGAEGVKWNHVLHYLKAHCRVKSDEDDEDDSDGNSNEESLQTRNRSNQKRASNGKKKTTNNSSSSVLLAENPLPDYYVASDELKQELWVNKAKGDSVLRSCLSSAPPKVIAALSFLHPEALQVPDSHNRVALHYACRYPVSERLDSVMKVLIEANPSALLKRDSSGRTPLHYLFWYHASERSAAIVALFCRSLSCAKQEFFKLRQPIIQKLPTTIDGSTGTTASTTQSKKRQQQGAAHQDTQNTFPLPDIPRPSQTNKIPINAAIVPDSTHGCIPLHYAVMEGASVDAIQVLYRAYPQSKHFVDRYGRTPLHWYLGAGTLNFWYRDSSFPPQHVSGEEVQADPKLPGISNQPFNRLINHDIVQTLLSSRVARTADFQQRYPLHWVAAFLAHNYVLSDRPGWAMSLQIVQLLLDNFVGQLICFDEQKMTPAMVLFDTVAKIQLNEWKQQQSDKQQKQRKQQDLVHGGSAESLFGPPVELLEMLLKHPDPTANANVAAMEDVSGRLPIHAALEVACTPECIALLVKYHPTALIHTAEDTLHVPLHSAFCHEYTAPLQTADIITLLLQSIHAGRYGTVVDGRLAMRMEDSGGYYPIHVAIQNGACLDVIKTLVSRYPSTALIPTPSGDLPLHCLLTDERVLNIIPACRRTSMLNRNGSTDETIQTGNTINTSSVGIDESEDIKVVREKMYTLLRPLLSDPGKLAIADAKFGMLPLHCAVLLDAADYPLLLRMLELYPSSAAQFTKSHLINGSIELASKTALDLHEMSKPQREISNAWLRKRELLFSFNPTLESHRHRQELLDQCVRLVIDELGEAKPHQDTSDPQFRYHLLMNKTMKDDTLELELTHSVSNMEKAVLKSFGFKESRPPRHTTFGTLSPKSRSSSLTLKHSGSISHNEDSKMKKERKRNKRKKDRAYTNKSSASMYDDENTSFGTDTYNGEYETGEGDDTESLFSGVESDEASSSEVDDDESDEDGSDRDSEGEILSGGPSRSLGYTSSGSRLRTTFEEGSGGSDEDESRTDEDDDDDDSRSFSCTDDTGTRQTYDDDESTLLTRQHTTDSDRKNAFDSIKDNLEAEEKKDDYSFGTDIKAHTNRTPKADNICRRQQLIQSKIPKAAFQKPDYMSEVAMRLWSFFVLYCDPHNPNDNYVKQVSDIIDEIKFSTIEKLLSIPLPPYAKHYFVADDWEQLNFRDVASPKCRELLHKTCYFVGRYDLHLQHLQQQESKISILVDRSPDNSTVTIRALEWLFTTEEKTAARDTGVAVENIWATGEFPSEIGVTFKSLKRAVWIKFTKDQHAYENEVLKRNAFGLAADDDDDNGNDKSEELCYNAGVVPLLTHYNSMNSKRKKDRTYYVDINDERFNVVKLYAGDCNSAQTEIRLNDYPYALVYPASILGSPMSDYCLQNGLIPSNAASNELVEENRRLCSSVALTLRKMHEKDVVHADVSLSSLAMFPDSKATAKHRVLFLDLSKSHTLSDKAMFLGGISAQGYPQFKTDTLPPEMFTKLSPKQLKTYTDYWIAIQDVFHVKVDKYIIEPILDLQTGERYVAKCHFIPVTMMRCSTGVHVNGIPPLPYDLVPVSASADLWAIGQLIFLLCTGQTILKVDMRRESLISLGALSNWTAEPLIYEHVNDPVAQDVLLSLLANKQHRDMIQFEKILDHPFFTGNKASSSLLMKQIIEKRRVECAAHRREQRKRFQEKFENEWLNGRSHSITCWDFNVLERIHLSPSQIVRALTTRNVLTYLPCNFMFLPYKLFPSSRSQFMEMEFKQAKRMGEDLLHLSKACYFTSVMQQATNCQDEDVPHKWSSSEMLRVLDLSSDDFGEIQNEMANLAAKHVEAFRTNPMSVAMKLVQKRINKLLSCFEDNKLYLYVVDEFNGAPILRDIFPVEIPDDVRECILQNGVLVMHLCSLHARGVSKGVSGLAKILFNDENQVIPPSWTCIAQGLKHKLDEVAFVKEVQLLQDALTELYSTKHQLSDDIRVIHDYLAEVDPDRVFADLRRVEASGAWIWTSSEEATVIEEMAKSISFKDALNRSRIVDAKLNEQESVKWIRGG